MSDTISSDGTDRIITENIILPLHDKMQIQPPDDDLTITVTSSEGTLQPGDVLLANTMPEAEYMYGCTPTAVGMILGYYDLYGYRGADYSALIDGDVDLKSRGTDGNAYDMDAFDTVLGRAIASEDYVYRFFSRGDLDIITGNKAGTYWTTSAEEELEYSFVNGGEGPELRTDVWNCIADYLGTGQLWRGNDNLSTSISQSTTLEDLLNYNMNINYIAGDLQRLVDWRYTSMQYGLYLYVESKGYSLDPEITRTCTVDTNGGDFTFEDYKAEIDAGRPVLISLVGHSIVGYGYNPETNEIIFDDCYLADQRMVWGETYLYSGWYLPLESITVIALMGGGGADIAVTPVSADSGEIFFTSNAVPFASGDYCYPGDPVSVNFTVSNLGTTACDPFAVTIYVDGTLSQSIAVLSLEGNSSAEYTDIQLGALAPGLHTVRVVADEANEIQETSGANNVLEQKLMVLKDGANIVTGIKAVDAGEVSRDDYVASGWQMHVLNGGTASGTVVRGIVTDVAPNGTVTYLPGLAVVSQGGLIQDAEVYEYGQIQLAGTAEDLHVFENGTAVIQPGGKLTGKLTVENGGGVSMDEGTVLDFDLTQTEAGAEALVNDLSRVQGTPVYTLTVDGTQASGTYSLADGASGFNRTITVQNTAGESIGTLTVGNTLTIDKADYLLALDDSALTVTVASEKNVFSSDLTNETKDITSDWSAVNVNINEGGQLNILDGGTAANTTVNEDGHFNVSSGGTVNSTTVNSSGCLRVFSGGIANSTTVNRGSMYVSSGGIAISTTVNSGGKLYVNPGGTATGIKAEFGASLNLTVAPNTHISGTYAGSAFEVEDGIISNYTVNSGGWLRVFSGGIANSTTVNSGGRLDVSSGGTVNSTTVNRGSMYVSSGGIANSTTVNARGRLDVSSGGTANSTTVNSNSDVPNCGFIVASGGTAISTTVNSGGKLYVNPGGTATGIKAEFGASLNLTVAPNTHISGTYAGSAFEVEDGIISNYTVNSGHLAVGYSGGTAISTTVNSSGWLEVLFGGVANSTTVNSGGSMIVSRSGVANSTTVNGYLYVSSGGTANSTTVNGYLYVSSGGTANSTTVNSGGSLYVSSGGTMTGQMIFEEGAIVSVDYYCVTLDFDISELAAEAGARVNNLAIIQGTPLYTLTVGGTEAAGTYALAGGAAGFTGTISVMNTSGDKLGTLTVGGETVLVGGTGYTLNLTDSILSVTVKTADSPAPLTPANPVGTADKVSWDLTGAAQYIVEYSTDNFEHVIRVITTGNAVDTPDLPAGTYQWRVKADFNIEWTVGEAIAVAPGANSSSPKVVQSNKDGNDELFFATPVDTWGGIYYAQHVGSLNDGWSGTNELISANRKGRIQNLFFGSTDPNVLCLTDGENGDAIFVDDVYTDLPESVAEHTARLYQIQEIRAGAGNDIVDMTSQRFEYVGNGLTIRGGDGDDVIWASKGDNYLFGDTGNDRIVGASGNDIIAGGIGNDSLHGGGGDDIFVFCDNWGEDTVQQLETGSVTLWFASGAESNWDAETLTYTDGDNSVTVSGVAAEKITLKFGDDGSAQFAELSGIGAFDAFTSRNIFEEADKGILANA